MNRKIARIIQLAVFACLTVTSVQADFSLRMAPVLAADFAMRPNINEVSSVFGDENNLFWGPQIEIITDHVGVGFRGLVDFNESETGLDDPQYNWALDWLGDLFVTYHLFGGKAFIDPFIELGFGNAGRVDISGGNYDWNSSEYEWMDEDEYIADGALESIALYPSVAAGVSVNLNDFFVGARLAYRPTVFLIPATQFDPYPLTNFQVSLFGGVSLGQEF